MKVTNYSNDGKIVTKNYKANIVSTIEKGPSKIKTKLFVSVGGVFGAIFLFLLVIVVIRSVGNIGTGDLTFTGFLNYLSTITAPAVDLSVVNIPLLDDWGIFNFLRVFINALISVFNFAVSVTQMIINAMYFLFKLVSWVFVGA